MSLLAASSATTLPCRAVLARWNSTRFPRAQETHSTAPDSNQVAGWETYRLRFVRWRRTPWILGQRHIYRAADPAPRQSRGRPGLLVHAAPRAVTQPVRDRSGVPGDGAAALNPARDVAIACDAGGRHGFGRPGTADRRENHTADIAPLDPGIVASLRSLRDSHVRKGRDVLWQSPRPFLD